MFVEVPQNYSALGIPQTIQEVPYGTVDVPAGTGTPEVSIPITPAEAADAQNGLVTLDFAGTIDGQFVTSVESVQVSPSLDPQASTAISAAPGGGTDYQAANAVVMHPSPGTTSAQSAIRLRAARQLANRARRSHLRRPRTLTLKLSLRAAGQALTRAEHRPAAPEHMTPGPVAHTASMPCGINTYGGPVEITARLGQIQDSDGVGASVEWQLSQSQTSTYGIGVSLSPATGFTADGTESQTATVGTHAYYTGTNPDGSLNGFNWYVDTHVYRQEYTRWICQIPGSAQEYVVQAEDPQGDIIRGTNQPPTDPYGRCGGDPYGYVTQEPNGGWGQDRGTATTYSGGITMFGVGFTSQSGYSSDNYIQWNDNESIEEHECGNNGPAAVGRDPMVEQPKRELRMKLVPPLLKGLSLRSAT